MPRVQLDNGQILDFVNEPTPHDIDFAISQLKANPTNNQINTSIPSNTEISAPKSPLNLKPMTPEEQATAQNIGAISRISGQRISDVANQYQGKTPETGLKQTFPIGMYRDPTTLQLVKGISDIPIKAGIIAGLATNPIATGAGLAVGYPVFKGIDYATQKATEALPQNTPDALKEAIGVGGYAGGLAAGGKIVGGIQERVGQKLPAFFTQQAGRLVNSLIKPNTGERAFGKNAGQGVAQEGLWSPTLPGLKTQVDTRLNDLKSEIANVKESRPGDNIDLGRGVIQPLYDLRTKFADMPRSGQTILNRIQNHIDDIIMNPDGSYRKLNNLSIESAYKIKYMLRDMQKWANESPLDNKTDKALKQVYHNIDTKIDEKFPELAILNSRMANLITASQAIEHRINLDQNKNPLQIPHTLWGTVTSPIRAGLQAPITRTGIAALIANKYPKPNSSIQDIINNQ